LLLTTDGTAVNRMTHPRYGVERSYRVLVHGLTTDQITRALSRPVMIEGRPVALSTFQARAAERGRTDMRLVLTEGRYRIVRRLCDQLGLKVERLTRLSHGPVRLGRLAAGKWRYLTRNELAALSSSRT